VIAKHLAYLPSPNAFQHPEPLEAVIHSKRGMYHHLAPILARSLTKRPDGAPSGVEVPVFSECSPCRPISCVNPRPDGRRCFGLAPLPGIEPGY